MLFDAYLSVALFSRCRRWRSYGTSRSTSSSRAVGDRCLVCAFPPRTDRRPSGPWRYTRGRVIC